MIYKIDAWDLSKDNDHVADERPVWGWEVVSTEEVCSSHQQHPGADNSNTRPLLPLQPLVEDEPGGQTHKCDHRTCATTTITFIYLYIFFDLATSGTGMRWWGRGRGVWGWRQGGHTGRGAGGGGGEAVWPPKLSLYWREGGLSDTGSRLASSPRPAVDKSHESDETVIDVKFSVSMKSHLKYWMIEIFQLSSKIFWLDQEGGPARRSWEDLQTTCTLDLDSRVLREPVTTIRTQMEILYWTLAAMTDWVSGQRFTLLHWDATPTLSLYLPMVVYNIRSFYFWRTIHLTPHISWLYLVSRF